MDLLTLRAAAGGGSIDGLPAPQLIAAGFTRVENLDELEVLGLDYQAAEADLRERLSTRADRLAGRIQLMVERTGTGDRDPIGAMMLALSGMDARSEAERLDLPTAQLIPLTAHLSDTRRSRHSVETVLKVATGMELQVLEAQPTWMAVPPQEQSRLGFGRLGNFNQLGVPDDLPPEEAGQAAMIGAAVLDVQHHFLIVIGPMPYERLRAFCAQPNLRRLVSQLAALAAGLDQRPSLRLRIAAREVPPLRLGCEDTPAMLGWTTWLGEFESDADILDDCVIPIDNAAIHQEKAVVEAMAEV